MSDLTFLSDDEIRMLVAQVRTAQRWTNPLIQTRLKTRPDGRGVLPPLITALARGSGFSQALAHTLTQLPHLMRESLASEPSRPWSQLMAHNTRTLQGEIETVMRELTAVALGRAKLRRTFEIAAGMWHEEAAALEQTLAGETIRFHQIQQTHRGIVRDVQGNRLGWLSFLLNLLKGDALTRLVETCNERESLALEMDTHQAAAAILAQAASVAQQRAATLGAKAETLANAEASLKAEMDTLKTRLQSRLPFLTQSADNWRIAREYAHAQADGTLPRALVLGLADVTVPATALVNLTQGEAKQKANALVQSLNVLTAFELEAQQLGVVVEDETQHPLLLVGEALLRECLEGQPRFWLTPLAHPREFLFQVAPASAAPFDLTESHVAHFDPTDGTTGYLGFVHIQLGLAREDLDAYAQTRAAFIAAQDDHNLFVIDELAKQWNRRWRKRQSHKPRMPRRVAVEKE